MSVISMKNHKKILEGIKQRARWSLFCVAVIAFTLALVLSSLNSDERPLNVDQKFKIIETLRTKPLTVGQSLDVAEAITDQCEKSQVTISLALGVLDVESEGFPYAVSRQDARGLMQLRESIFNHYLKLLGVEGLNRHRFDPALNVRVGIMYLGDLINQYGLRKGLAVYFTGKPVLNQTSQSYIKKVLEKAKVYRVALN